MAKKKKNLKAFVNFSRCLSYSSEVNIILVCSVCSVLIFIDFLWSNAAISSFVNGLASDKGSSSKLLP